MLSNTLPQCCEAVTKLVFPFNKAPDESLEQFVARNSFQRNLPYKTFSKQLEMSQLYHSKGTLDKRERDKIYEMPGVQQLYK